MKRKVQAPSRVPQSPKNFISPFFLHFPPIIGIPIVQNFTNRQMNHLLLSNIVN